MIDEQITLKSAIVDIYDFQFGFISFRQKYDSEYADNSR